MRITLVPPFKPLLLAMLLCTGLSGCGTTDLWTFPPQTRGNKVDPENLVQLVPGTSSRADVTSLIGSPTAKATFDDNTWLYISEVTTPVIAGRLAEHEQHVVVMKFDQAGTLRSIDKKGMDDAQPISMAAGATPSPGNNVNILQELLGNVGRFTPGVGGNSPTSGGTAGAPQTGY